MGSGRGTPALNDSGRLSSGHALGSGAAGVRGAGPEEPGAAVRVGVQGAAGCSRLAARPGPPLGHGTFSLGLPPAAYREGLEEGALGEGAESSPSPWALKTGVHTQVPPGPVLLAGGLPLTSDKTGLAHSEGFTSVEKIKEHISQLALRKR